MAAHEHETGPAIHTFLLATVFALATGFGMVGIARQVAGFGPKIGDIIAFDPAHPAGMDSVARVSAARPDREACILDAAVLRRSGGSLVVEQRGPDTLLRAHWSGPRTSDAGGEDCGTDADLLLSSADTGALAAAAGGFGADHASGVQVR